MTVPNGSSKVDSTIPRYTPPSSDHCSQGNTFLFTSESVGEGHPDKIWYVNVSFFFHAFLSTAFRAVFLRGIRDGRYRIGIIRRKTDRRETALFSAHR